MLCIGGEGCSVNVTTRSVYLRANGLRCVCAAIGCATPTAPENGWVDRGTSETAIVGCNFTGQRWYLHCDGRRWVGDRRNCTALDAVGLYATNFKSNLYRNAKILCSWTRTDNYCWFLFSDLKQSEKISYSEILVTLSCE